MKTIRKIKVIQADPISWLQEKDKFVKDHSILQEISNIALVQQPNPMFGKGGLHHPGQPQYIMTAFIVSAFVYEEPVTEEKPEIVIPLTSDKRIN